MHLLIIGDISFFYDRNGLWTDRLPANLRVAVLNDGCGGIFSVIDGPALYPRAYRFFATPHKRSCRHTADEFGIAYLAAESHSELERAMPELFERDGGLKILEIRLRR